MSSIQVADLPEIDYSLFYNNIKGLRAASNTRKKTIFEHSRTKTHEPFLAKLFVTNNVIVIKWSAEFHQTA